MPATIPGATRMAAKLIFDPNNGTILGAQIVGRNGVDKRIDVIATAMAGGITADRLADLELAYAPPFSSAKDPVNLLGYMAENVLSGDCDVVDPQELGELVASGWTLVDVRTAEEHALGAIEGSRNIPIDALRDHLDDLGSQPVVVYCEVGQRGHTATALLRELGIKARNLDGGYQTWSASVRAQREVGFRPHHELNPRGGGGPPQHGSRGDGRPEESSCFTTRQAKVGDAFGLNDPGALEVEAAWSRSRNGRRSASDAWDQVDVETRRGGRRSG